MGVLIGIVGKPSSGKTTFLNALCNTSAKTADYPFTTINPNQGVGYFRLNDSEGNILYNFEPDFGGFAVYEFGIGNITSVNNEQETIAVATYPNPSTSKVNVHLSGLEQGNYTIKLLSATNTLMQEQSQFVNNNELRTVLDLRSLPAGVYLMQVSNGSNLVTKKIIKK